MENLNYGVIGNCRSAALISERGSIDWCCLPDFDSPSVFSKLLDEHKGGHFNIEVPGNYIISQKYLGNTNVLCTQYSSEEGCFEVIDFMPRYKTTEHDYFNPAEIYRYIRYISGFPVLSIDYQPKFNYAAEEVSHVVEDDHIRTYSKINPIDCIFLYSNFNLEDILKNRRIEITEHSYLLLSYTQKLIPIDLERVYLEYQRTKVYWLNWNNRSKKYNLYSEQINRSLLILKLMSFHPSGAVLASLTTSIPEVIGEERNWDYRFCWLRDASMSIETLFNMGHYVTAKSFLNFIKNIIRSKHDIFQIMYGIRGERKLTERILPYLEGYMGSKPVRVGNAAYIQKQNDGFGYMLDVIYKYYKHFPGTLDEIEDIWEIVRHTILIISTHWEKPDKGIWEFRYEEKHFVFSKVMCWVAMDRASKIAELLNKKNYAEDWKNIAHDIKEEILVKGWNESMSCFTQAYGDECLDASLLLLDEYGFIDSSDERFRSTVQAIKNNLFKDGLMYRYIRPDDFGQSSSSFTICTFWLIKALFNIGQVEEAKQIFDNILTYCNHLGLYSEDIDFKTKRLLGNFPQAYSHLALINTAILFSKNIELSQFIKP